MDMRSVWRGAAAGVAILALAGCGEKISREDFQTRVQNATESEVRKNLGKPDTSQSSGPDETVWVYNQKTFNIDKGNTFDARTLVVFKASTPGGEARVAEVKFE